MAILLKNNASGILSAAVSALDTSFVLQTGDGAAFPSLGSGDYFYATVQLAVNALEIVKVTARVGDVLTVVRAQEGTSALPFDAGSLVELRVTAQSVIDVASDIVEGKYIDYTPTISGATTPGVGTYTSQNGRYVVKGKECTVRFGVNLLGHSGTGWMRLDLPVLPANGAYGVVVFDQGTYTAGAQVACYTVPGYAYLLFSEFHSGATVLTLNMPPPALLDGQITYEIA